MNENLTNMGANENPAAGGSTSVQADNPAASGNPVQAGGAGEETQSIPVSVVQRVREELKTAKDQAALYRRQLELAGGGKKTGEDPFSGLADDAPLTAGQARKALQNQRKQMDVISSQLAFSLSNPGFADTIKNNLPKMLKDNPGLMQLISSSPAPLEAAYSLARLAPSAGSQTDVGDQMARILRNSEKPGSASAAAGGAGISPASRIAKMSDAEFAEYKELVKAGKVSIGG